jgi:ribose transport system substrate-binding protein
VSPDTLAAIKAGTIDSTVVQKPYTMGYVGLKVLDQILHDAAVPNKDFANDPFSPYPAFVDTGTSLVDKSNVDVYIAAAAAKQ